MEKYYLSIKRRNGYLFRILLEKRQVYEGKRKKEPLLLSGKKKRRRDGRT